MNNLNSNLEKNNNSENTDSVKKAYHSPELTPYGNLSELVQVHPARGADGSIAPDCTLS